MDPTQQSAFKWLCSGGGFDTLTRRLARVEHEDVGWTLLVFLESDDVSDLTGREAARHTAHAGGDVLRVQAALQVAAAVAARGTTTALTHLHLPTLHSLPGLVSQHLNVRTVYFLVRTVPGVNGVHRKQTEPG